MRSTPCHGNEQVKIQIFKTMLQWTSAKTKPDRSKILIKTGVLLLHIPAHVNSFDI
jgi:hypothetical protein